MLTLDEQGNLQAVCGHKYSEGCAPAAGRAQPALYILQTEHNSLIQQELDAFAPTIRVIALTSCGAAGQIDLNGSCMSQPSKTFKVVAGVHIGLVAVLFFHSGVKQLFEPKPEIISPIEFVVDATPLMSDVSEVFPGIPEPEPVATPIPEPIAAPVPEPTPVAKPAPKPKPRKPIEISRRKVSRSGDPKPPPQKTLSEAEIRKLLAEGAKAGDYTSIPDEDSRCLALIQQTLYTAWVQPSSEAVGDAVAVLRVSFDPDGRVRSCELEGQSGSAALDASVLQIANSIQRIHGLTSDFIRHHASVTVSFKVE